MKCITISRALFVRLCFACHGLISVYLLYRFTHNKTYWYLACAMAGLFLEFLVTLIRHYGNEWKWFCPSVFFYLLSVVPTLWCFELELYDVRGYFKCINVESDANFRSANISTRKRILHACVYEHNMDPKVFLFAKNDSIIADTMEKYIGLSEQVLLLFLILGRWFLPKGKLSHDQLSQLLLVYLGTAADIAEFFDSFKEAEVKQNKVLTLSVLAVWSCSLLQFAFVLTATKVRKDQSGIMSDKIQSGMPFVNWYSYNWFPITSIVRSKSKSAASSEWLSDVYGILISISLQDCPFLVFRLTLIFRYWVVSHTNVFFTAKNSLVITLLVYRLVVIWNEHKKRMKTEEDFDSLESYTISKKIDIFNNGGVPPQTQTEEANPKLLPPHSSYSCNETKNWKSNYSSYIDLESGCVIKSDSDSCIGKTSKLQDQNRSRNSLITKTTNLIEFDSPFKPKQNPSASETELTNKANNSSDFVENPMKEETDSKLTEAIELICKEAETFLQKQKSKTSSENQRKGQSNENPLHFDDDKSIKSNF